MTDSPAGAEGLVALRDWLTGQIEKLNKDSLYRRGTAESMRHSTASDLREGHRIAEQMAGRKLRKTSVADERKNALVEDRIADKIEAEIYRLKGFIEALDALVESPPVGREGLRELRELSEKATPGKWVRSVHCFQIVAIGPLDEESSFSVTELNCPRGLEKYPTSERIEHHKDDVDFIVACVNYVRAALATPAASASANKPQDGQRCELAPTVNLSAADNHIALAHSSFRATVCAETISSGMARDLAERREPLTSNTCLSEAIHWLSRAKAANRALEDEIDDVIEEVGAIAQNEAMRALAGAGEPAVAPRTCWYERNWNCPYKAAASPTPAEKK